LARLVQLARACPASTAPLDRADWPKHCAARLQRDIVNLKQIIERWNSSAGRAT
jgi:hypothetical protein